MQKQLEDTFTDDDGTIRVFCTQHAAMPGFKLMQRLGKALGPAMGQLKGLALKDDASAAAPALGALFGALNEDEFEALARDLLSGCMVTGVGPKVVNLNNLENINLVFGGRLLTMLKVMVFAAKTNFADFFKALGTTAKPAPSPGAPDASAPANESTSPSA